MHCLRDDHGRGRELERRSEPRALGAGHAVRRPDAPATDERAVVRRVPVTRREDRKARRPEHAERLVQGRDHGIPIGHAQCAPGKKVILYVHDQERVPGARRSTLHRLSLPPYRRTGVRGDRRDPPPVIRYHRLQVGGKTCRRRPGRAVRCTRSPDPPVRRRHRASPGGRFSAALSRLRSRPSGPSAPITGYPQPLPAGCRSGVTTRSVSRRSARDPPLRAAAEPQPDPAVA